MMTADTEWVPSILDNIISTTDTWKEDTTAVTPGNNTAFDANGDYRHRTVAAHYQDPSAIHDAFFDSSLFDDNGIHFFDAKPIPLDNLDDNIRSCMTLTSQPDATSSHDDSSLPATTTASPTITTKHTPDFASLHPYFGWQTPHIVQMTV